MLNTLNLLDVARCAATKLRFLEYVISLNIFLPSDCESEDVPAFLDLFRRLFLAEHGNVDIVDGKQEVACSEADQVAGGVR